jgi:2-methylisocitrate lyase-like PEP mutase family enzyme
MMEWLGYPAVATASASVAYSLGYDDGQQITLEAMLDVVGRVAAAVKVPVTADMEWGYAEQPRDVAENMRRVLRAGAVGINLEDSIREGELLFDVDFQCARIRAVRDVARQEGVPLFIQTPEPMSTGPKSLGRRPRSSTKPYCVGRPISKPAPTASIPSSWAT